MSNGKDEIYRWESGELGTSMEHARPAPPELSAQVDAALGLETVELRLSTELVAIYKKLAEEQGIGWKPLMRQALGQYAQAGDISL